MPTLMERLTTDRAEREADNREQLKRLRIAEADGLEFNGNADELLHDLDMQPADLQAEVGKLTERRRWAADLAAGNAAEAEQSELEDQIRSAERSLEALIQAEQEKIHPLRERRAASRQAVSRAFDAKRRLVDTATDPIVLEQIRRIDQEFAKLRKRQAEADRVLRDVSGWVQRVTSLGNAASSIDQKRLPQKRDELARLQDDYKDFTRQAAELQSRRSEAEQMLLDPNCI